MSVRQKIQDVRESILGKDREPGGMPHRYQRITWKQDAREQGLVGDQHKTILIMEGGKVDRRLPYSEHLMKALREHKNLPVFDETGGKSVPEPDVLETVEPGVVRMKG